MPLPRIWLLLPALVLAGCAATRPAGPAGRHLVYRDTAGIPSRQFDYPDVEFCRRVEAIAGRSARCQAESLAGDLQAKASLRYSPPGVLVDGHYRDMARCRTDTGALPPGVELVIACMPK